MRAVIGFMCGILLMAPLVPLAWAVGRWYERRQQEPVRRELETNRRLWAHYRRDQHGLRPVGFDPQI